MAKTMIPAAAAAQADPMVFVHPRLGSSVLSTYPFFCAWYAIVRKIAYHDGTVKAKNATIPMTVWSHVGSMSIGCRSFV